MADTSERASVQGGNTTLLDEAYERELLEMRASAASSDRVVAQPVADPTSHLSPDAPR